VPYTRGEEFSRPVADVMNEIEELAKQGVREITLLGQNVNGYRGMDKDDEVVDFSLLIYFVSKVQGIERIRYTSSHPIEFSDNLINAYGEVPELVNHVHLPVQSGSDRVLAAMKRGHTALEFKSIVKKLRKQRPDVSISSDFIIGFPGESDKDFEDTMKFVEEIGFDQSFSFIYSRRPGTPAASLEDDVPAEVKKARLKRFQQLINSMATQYSEEMLGTDQVVLVEGLSKKSDQEYSGRTENNRVVNFGVPDKIKDNVIGMFLLINITEVFSNSLRGTYLSTIQ
jgi:tRNA-2-methylthio-N6-dimethylallyladenosine synthase